MPTEFKSFYKTVGGNEGNKCHYPTRLDTYGCGCSHDCSYCYAKSLLDFRKMWHPDNPSVADIASIEKKLKKIPSGTVLRLGGMTDCLQPIEQKYNVTYQTIELLNKYGIGYLIVTKSAIIGTEKYVSILDPKLAHIQVTVTTTDDALAAKYEKASKPSERILAINTLFSKGFDVAIRLSPFVAEFYDFALLREKVHCEKAIVEFLRVNTWIKKWFDLDFSRYTLKQSNYYHLPLEDKKKALKLIPFANISVCDDYTEHYEYWKHNYNPNQDDCCNLRV